MLLIPINLLVLRGSQILIVFGSQDDIRATGLFRIEAKIDNFSGSAEAVWLVKMQENGSRSTHYFKIYQGVHAP